MSTGSGRKQGNDTREAARAKLIGAIQALGYPPEFGEVLAGELRGERSMSRMTGYLRQAHPKSTEEIVDEMLAICSMCDSIAERKASEHAQASMTRFINRELDEDSC